MKPWPIKTFSIITPSIAKSASIAMIGQGWSAVGPTGEASFQLPLPISSGRGADPQLSLSYSSQSGNGPFGIGWNLGNGQIRRRTNKGVPLYGDDDEIIGHDAQICMPERNDDGTIKSRTESSFNGKDIGVHSVVRYSPEVESVFTIRERWQPVIATPGEQKPVFWLVYGPDGSLHMYGKTADSRVADPDDPLRVGVWLPVRKHDRPWRAYLFRLQDRRSRPRPRSMTTALSVICTGRCTAISRPARICTAWTVERLAELGWHFHLLFDYGERTDSLTEKPVYDGAYPCDPGGCVRMPFRPLGYGFEVSTRRRCQQVLMFHHFPAELGRRTGVDPTAAAQVQREHHAVELQPDHLGPLSSLGCQRLRGKQPAGGVRLIHRSTSTKRLRDCSKRTTCRASRMAVSTSASIFTAKAVPGFLCRYDQCWYYREPVRETLGTDDIRYSPWTALDKIPVANRNKPVLQILTDLTGDGRLDWITAQPGLSGFRTLKADRTWAEFKPFTLFPIEFLQCVLTAGRPGWRRAYARWP